MANLVLGVQPHVPISLPGPVDIGLISPGQTNQVSRTPPPPPGPPNGRRRGRPVTEDCLFRKFIIPKNIIAPSEALKQRQNDPERREAPQAFASSGVPLKSGGECATTTSLTEGGRDSLQTEASNGCTKDASGRVVVGGGNVGGASSSTTTTTTTTAAAAVSGGRTNTNAKTSTSHRPDSLLRLPPEMLHEVFIELRVQDMVCLALTSRHMLSVAAGLQKVGIAGHTCEWSLREYPNGYSCDATGIDTMQMIRAIGSGRRVRGKDGEEVGKEALKFCSGCKKWVSWDFNTWGARIDGETTEEKLSPRLPGQQQATTGMLDKDTRRFLMVAAAEVWCGKRDSKTWLEGYRRRNCPKCWEKDAEARAVVAAGRTPLVSA